MEKRTKKESTLPKVKIRTANLKDIPMLVELNRVAYPSMAETEGIWNEVHLKSHQRMFPQGQLLAEVNGEIVGSASSLIVSLGIDPLRNHTWSGITDSGFFTNHDPTGDTLYGADACVNPKFRGFGVGAKLYKARRDLCKKLNLRRILAGGRLWNYTEHQDEFSPTEYAERVSQGEFKDLVLSFQLREGFVLRGVMPNYIRDPRSKNFATLIEWTNPDYKPTKKGPRKVRVACVQYQMRKVNSFADFASKVKYFVDIAADYKSDFVLFPEFFTVELLSQVDAKTPQDGIKKLAGYTERFKKLMSGLAKQYDITIIAGSQPTKIGKKLENISYVCLPSGEVFGQSKLHVTPNERKWWGITGGTDLSVIQTPTAKIGVLICYDVEFPETARALADQGVEIIFVPFCTDTRQGYLRVRYCAQARPIENQIYVAIAGNVGNLPDVQNMDIQYAQAAVFAPSDFPFGRDGIVAEAESNEETVLICDLDLDDLHEARSHGTVTPILDRRSDLFRTVTTFNANSTTEETAVPLGDSIIRSND